MSDFIAVLVIGSRIVHCVDYDRPVWFPVNAMDESIVPSPEHFLADALVAFASDLLKLEPFSWNRYGLGNKQFPSGDAASSALTMAREKVYAATQPGLLYVSLGSLQRRAMDDLGRLSMPVTLAEEVRPPQRPASPASG